MRKVSDKICRENLNTLSMFSNLFFWTSCHLLDNVEDYGTARQTTDGNVMRHMRFALSITKASPTHSEYVTLIAITWQKWLHECSSVLLYTHIICLVVIVFLLTLCSHSFIQKPNVQQIFNFNLKPYMCLYIYIYMVGYTTMNTDATTKVEEYFQLM